MSKGNWSRAYCTVLALSFALIPGAAYLGTVYVGRTLQVGVFWGLDGFRGLVGLYYWVGPVGYSLVGVGALAGMIALWPVRAKVVSVLGASTLLLVSMCFYGAAVLDCSHLIHCVVEGTRISTPHGSVRVEELRPGDSIWTRAPQGSRQPGRVEAIRKCRANDYLEIALRDGAMLKVTDTHLIAAVDSWRVAARLRPDDTIHTLSGTAAVASVARVHAPVTVYDLTVEPNHNYFANGCLVHNKILWLSAGGESPFDDDLRMAVLCNDPDGARRALDAGANVNCYRGDGSMLHVAVRNGNQQMCEIFLAAGVDLTLRDPDGMTPTMLAAILLHSHLMDHERDEQTEARREIFKMLAAADPAGEQKAAALQDSLGHYYEASVSLVEGEEPSPRGNAE